MSANESLARLEEACRRNEDDIRGLKEQLLAIEFDSKGVEDKLEKLGEALDKHQEAFTLVKEDVKEEIQKSTSSHISTLVRRVSLLFGGSAVATVVLLLAAMWGFQPIRLFVLDSLNSAVHFDEYLAYKLTDKLPTESQTKTPLLSALTDTIASELGTGSVPTELRKAIIGALVLDLEVDESPTKLKEAITRHVNTALADPKGINLKAHLLALRKEPEFNQGFDKEIFEKIASDYAKFDVFKEIVALSFPHKKEGLTYNRHIATPYEMRFYATEDDRAHIFCTFAFSGRVYTPRIEFILNGKPMPSLTQIVTQPNSEVLDRRINLSEGGEKSMFARGVHQLVMMVTPPNSQAFRGDAAEFQKELDGSSMDVDCFIAVIGPTLATALSKRREE